MIADVQYYTYKEVKAVNPDVQVTTPGFSTRREGEGFLDVLYEAIESAAHPFGEDFADTTRAWAPQAIWDEKENMWKLWYNGRCRDDEYIGYVQKKERELF